MHIEIHRERAYDLASWFLPKVISYPANHIRKRVRGYWRMWRLEWLGVGFYFYWGETLW